MPTILHPGKPWAILDLLSGHGIVYEPDGRKFILRAEKDEPEDGAGIHDGMLLQPALSNLESREADEYPYKEVHDYLKLQHKVEDVLIFFAVVLDPSSELSHRRDGAHLLESYMADEAVAKAVRDRLQSMSLREDRVDTEHSPLGPLGAALLKEVLERQATANS